MMRGFDIDFLPKGTRFRPTFLLRVHVFDAFWCPSCLGRVVDTAAEGVPQRGGGGPARGRLWAARL